MKRKLLFVCVHNSARSQMAEAFLNRICSEDCEAQSAGLEPGTLNPLVVEVMREVGLDISRSKTKSVSDILRTGQLFSCVITVCDQAGAQRCPVFPGAGQRLHWSFPDPAACVGTREERLEQIRKIRDAIQARVEEWCQAVCQTVTGSFPVGVSAE